MAAQAKARYQEEMAEYQRKIDAGEITVDIQPKAKKSKASTGEAKAKESPNKSSFKSAEFVEDSSSGGDSSSLESDDDDDDDETKDSAKKEAKEEVSSEEESSADSD